MLKLVWEILPLEYHNNCPECMNNVIKMKVDRKRNSIDDFCSKMKSLVQEQRNHLIRAATCRGEYRLHPAFKEFEVSHLKWFGFTEGARYLYELQCVYEPPNDKQYIVIHMQNIPLMVTYTNYNVCMNLPMTNNTLSFICKTSLL